MKRLLGELAFLAGLGAMVWLVWRLGFKPVGQALASVGVGGILLLSLAHLPTLGILGASWWSLARDAPGSAPWKFAWGRLLRDAGGELLPFSHVGGFLMGARAVALAGASGLMAAVSGLLDMFVEQAAKTPYLVASIAALLWLAPQSGLVIPSLAILALTLAVIGFALVRRHWVRTKVEDLVVRVVKGWPAQVRADEAHTRAVVNAALAPGSHVRLSFLLHLIGWFLGAAEAWIALRLLGAPATFGQAMVIDGLFVAVRMFAFFVPAAVGVQEGAYIVLGALFGFSAPTMVAFSLLRRARDLVVGAPAVIVWQVLERRSLAARAGKLSARHS